MNTYITYNAVLAAIIVPIGYLLLKSRGRHGDLGAAVRVSVLMTLIGYPWDYFAIQLGVWDHPHDPGFRLHGVPLNDLVFMWLCSFLTCSVLLAARGRHHAGERHSERKDANGQDA